MEKKKIGLIGALLMGIGCIVGSGIFGSLPTVANEYGSGVVWALVGAAFVVVLRALSMAYTAAALPVSGAQLMWDVKLIHPLLAPFISFSTLLTPTMVSLFGVLFAMYVQPLFPNAEIDSTLAAVGLLVVFTVVAWFGNRTAINAGNIMVALLLIAIFLYIVLGIPNIDAANVTFGQIIKPGVTLSSLAAAVGVLTSSLSGASSVVQVADDVKNPGRTVPLALMLCPVIVAVIYILMAVVTIGVIPYAEVTSLADVAAHFMSPVLMTFFIVGGPICGIITSLIPIALACTALVEMAAVNKIFPSFMTKKNRFGVSYWCLLLVMGVAIAVCATGATFGIVMTIFSCCNTLSGLPDTLAPIFAYKKYPKTCDHSSLHMNKTVAAVMAVITFVIGVYLFIEMAATLSLGAVVGIVAVYVVGYVYFFIRVRYLKGKGEDLMAELHAPYEPWETKEKSYTEEDAR